MEEIWKDVVGYEWLYQVSNLGRVKSLRVKRHNEGIMTTKVRKNGYVYIFLNINGKRFWQSIHRLVAKAFIPNPENKPQIDHIDGNPSNNIVSNLRWATPKENSNNPVTIRKKRAVMSIVNQKRRGVPLSKKTKEKLSKARLGRFTGADNPFYGRRHSEETRKIMSKKKIERGGIPVTQLSKDGTFIKRWEHASIAGKTLNISPSNITECCKHKRKSIGGFKWEYFK